MAAHGEAEESAVASVKASVTVVTTADALVAAVSSGARDIEIRSHLDLTSLRRTPTRAVLVAAHPMHGKSTHLMYVGRSTRSIRGNCSDPGPAATLITTAPGLLPPPLPIKASQCVVIIGDSAMQFLGGTQWLDNIYFRLQRTAVDPAFVALEIAWPEPRTQELHASETPEVTLYMTNVSVQGQRRGSSHVLTAMRGSKVLAQDCIFSDWYGGSYPFHLLFQASINFIRSSIQNIAVDGGLLELGSGGIGRFANTTFQNIHTPEDLWVTSASDDLWLFSLADGSRTISLARPQRDVVRSVVLGDSGGSVGNRSLCGEVYIAEEDVLFDQAYGVFDYDYSTDYTMLPAVPFAFPEDAWFDSTRQDLPQRGPSNQSRPPTALELPDLPPSSLLSLCESGNTTSSNSEPRLWPTLTLEGFPYASDARVGKPRHGTHPGPALTVLLPVLVAAVLLAAAAAVFICLRPAMRPRPRTSRVMYTEKAVELGRARRRRSGKHRSPFAKPGLQDVSNAARASSSGRDVAESLFWAVPCTSYECRLPADPSIVQELRELHMTCDGHELGSRVESGVAASTHAHAGPGSDRGRDQASRTTRSAADKQYGSLRTSSSALATALSQYTPAEEAAQEKTTQSTNGIPSIKLMCEGMHAVGGETQPSVCRKVDPGQAPTAPANRQLAVLAKQAPGESPSKAWFKRWKEAVPRPGQGSGSSVTEEFEAGVTSVVVKQTLPCGRKKKTARAVQAQLRRFTANDVFLGQFVMCQQGSRFCGGNAIVQFATSCYDPFQYAIKFYRNEIQFRREACILSGFLSNQAGTTTTFLRQHRTRNDQTKQLGGAPLHANQPDASTDDDRQPHVSFLPSVVGIYAAGSTQPKDPHGRPLPPCVVMQRGESLQDWMGRPSSDRSRSSATAVLLDVSKCMAAMHDAGLAHLNIKPSNIMWFPQLEGGHWSITDFGCCARAGEAAPVASTLAYAAPEVVRAYLNSQDCMTAAPAMDCWALGVVALELFTGTPTFDLVQGGPIKVVAALVGQEPLPWTGSNKEKFVNELGQVAEIVMRLLNRDPSRRATARQVHTAFN